MSGFFSLSSIILGLISWIIPIIAMTKYQNQKTKNVFSFSFISFSACSLALLLQIFEVKNRIHLEDWAALMDTIDILSWVVIVLILITILLNTILLKISRNI